MCNILSCLWDQQQCFLFLIHSHMQQHWTPISSSLFFSVSLCQWNTKHFAPSEIYPTQTFGSHRSSFIAKPNMQSTPMQTEEQKKRRRRLNGQKIIVLSQWLFFFRNMGICMDKIPWWNHQKTNVIASFRFFFPFFSCLFVFQLALNAEMVNLLLNFNRMFISGCFCCRNGSGCAPTEKHKCKRQKEKKT